MKNLKVTEIIHLSEEETIVLMEKLEQDITPNNKLLEAAKLYKNKFHQEDLIPDIKGKELL